jgi:hypothetical protein
VQPATAGTTRKLLLSSQTARRASRGPR